MTTIIRGEENLSAQEIEKRINASEEYDTVSFEGVFRFEDNLKRVFLLGKSAVRSIVMVTKPNLRLDFSRAKIFVRLKELTCDTAFLYLYPTAKNLRVSGLDLRIDYEGENSAMTLYGLYNCGHSLRLENATVEIQAKSQVNATGVCNYGGLDTHLDTQADNLSVTGARVRVAIDPAGGITLPCEACGLRNVLANSIVVSDSFIEAKNRGEGEEQRAVGIYNNGRFCRFSADNVKANGSHNKGALLEEAHAFGMIDEGMYSLIGNSNIVGEWGGRCVGLTLKGEFSNVTGNKILSTHTIRGTTVRIEGSKILVNHNVLTSTSRNARIVSASGESVTVSGNMLEILMPIWSAVSGVGAYLEDGTDFVFADNQLRVLKTCGVYLKNCDAVLRDNRFRQDGREQTFVEVAEDREDLERLLDERAIRSLPLE